MNREGHLGAVLAAYAPVAFVAGALGSTDLAFLGAVAAVGTAMLPDVDLRIPFVRHRGPTHTVWFAVLAGVAGAFVGWTAGSDGGPVAALGLAAFGATVAGLAVGSHLAADALTPMGVRPFAPVSDYRVRLALTRADDPVANLLVLVGGAALALVGFALGRWVGGF